MKDTCVVRVNALHYAHFYRDSGDTAYVVWWPPVLKKKFRGVGVYSIQRVAMPTPKSIRTVVVGGNSWWDEIPAFFANGHYGICSRFLRELGVTTPPEGKRKTLHLVVTKRKAKK